MNSDFLNYLNAVLILCLDSKYDKTHTSFNSDFWGWWWGLRMGFWLRFGFSVVFWFWVRFQSTDNSKGLHRDWGRKKRSWATNQERLREIEEALWRHYIQILFLFCSKLNFPIIELLTFQLEFFNWKKPQLLGQRGKNIPTTQLP